MTVRSQGYRREPLGRLEMALDRGKSVFPARADVEIILRLQRSEGLELLSRAPDVTAARLLRQRVQFLSGGRAVLNKRSRTLGI